MPSPKATVGIRVGRLARTQVAAHSELRNTSTSDQRVRAIGSTRSYRTQSTVLCARNTGRLRGSASSGAASTAQRQASRGAERPRRRSHDVHEPDAGVPSKVVRSCASSAEDGTTDGRKMPEKLATLKRCSGAPAARSVARIASALRRAMLCRRLEPHVDSFNAKYQRKRGALFEGSFA